MRGIVCSIIVVSAFGVGICAAQSAEEEAIDENILESVLTNSDDVADTFVPVDLNEASEYELLSIPEMSTTCAASIVSFRKRNGIIRRFDDLSHIEGMTTEILSSLRRRAVISMRSTLNLNVMSYASVSLQRSPLFEKSYGEYGVMNFQRFNIVYGDFKAFAVTDKDPGESSYADFYSLSLRIGRLWCFSDIVAGDYTLSLGNGLLFSRGGMISKSAGAVTPLFTSRSNSLKPYQSKGENKFMRGVAFELPAGPFRVTVFGSSKSLSAVVSDSGSVTSVDYSGLHLPSQSPRESLLEQIAGGILRYESPELNAGVSGTLFSYDHKFQNDYLNRSIALESFTRLRLDDISFAGELLYDKAFSYNATFGVDYGDARFALGLRELRSRILQNYSGPLSESFPSALESGVYIGTTMHATAFLKFGLYYDRFAIKSRSGKPERDGEEIFADSYLTLRRKNRSDGSSTLVYIRYKYKTKEDSYIPAVDIPAALSVIAGSKQTVRLDFRHKFSAPFSFRSRIERNYLSSGEKGELLVIDTGWNPGRIELAARICFYRTDSYSAAFYTVEKDLPHVAEFTVLYGDGARLFLLGSWKANGSLTASVKISRDIYSRSREISVGASSRLLPGTTGISLEIGYSLD